MTREKRQGRTGKSLLYWILRQCEPSGSCLLWTGAKQGDGYGSILIGQKTMLVHRFVYEQMRGPILDGLHVRHSCDTPNCVAIQHLLTGTHQDNMRDKLERNRQSATLTPDDVTAIRKAASEGESQKDIAKRYGVGRACICKVVNRQSWRHLP